MKLCKHKIHTVLVANMSTERLGSCWIIFYLTDLLGKLSTRCAITPFFHHKNN